MTNRKSWPLVIQILVDEHVARTGRAPSRLTKSDWIEIACKAARKPGFIEHVWTASAKEQLPAGSKVVAPTHVTKKRGRPVKWPRSKARRYLEVFENLRKELGKGVSLSDLDTTKRWVARDAPSLRADKQLRKAQALAKNVAHFRKILKS